MNKTVLVLLFLLAACNSPLIHMEPEKLCDPEAYEIVPLNETLKVMIKWEDCPFPQPETPSHLIVTVLDDNLKPTKTNEGDQFFIRADMGMGHGLASDGIFFTNDSIFWENNTLSFYMGGKYKMTLYYYDKKYKELGAAEWFITF